MPRTSTFVLIHGGGDSAASWQYVAEALRDRAQEAIAVDLPITKADATLWDLAHPVIEAAAGRTELVVVAHSWGGFVAPLVAARLPTALLVLVAAMIPEPGEIPTDWWEHTGHGAATGQLDAGDEQIYYHDVPADRAAHARRAERPHRADGGGAPWPLAAWPDVPTRVLLARDDRVFPLELMREVAQDRLGIEADEIATGHLPHLAAPEDLAERLLAYRDELPGPA
jgi:pimeloyl-ACP methyl ester carboxylesterase